jgi:hypothetical protein
MNFVGVIPDQVGRPAPCHEIDDVRLSKSFRPMSTVKSKLISYTATSHGFKGRGVNYRRQHQWYNRVDYKEHWRLSQKQPDP